jgi:hypothetical protein
MIKKCLYCSNRFKQKTSFVKYCSPKCKSRDRFIKIQYGEKFFNIWKENAIKYPDFYSMIKRPKDRFKNKCLMCEKEFIEFRKCCSSECSLKLKKQTTFNSTGSEHNFAKNSTSRTEMDDNLFKNFGIVNIFQREDVKLKLKNTWIENHGVSNPTINASIRNKVRKTNENSGRWLKAHEKDEFELYCYHVKQFTNWNMNRFALKLWGNEFYKNWGFYENHLDHIFSKKEGFMQKIPANIIGSFVNLRMLPCKENLSKGIKCDITSEDLHNRYLLFEEENPEILREIETIFKESLKYVNKN